MLKKLFGEDVLLDVWKKVLAWVVVGLLGLILIFFTSDTFANFVTRIFATQIRMEVHSGYLVAAGVLFLGLVCVIAIQRRRWNAKLVALTSEANNAAIEPLPEPTYEPSERAVRVLEALTTPGLPDNEASAQELANLLQANVHTVQVALIELFQNQYVRDSWHSNNRWFRLSTTGQAYALERGFIEDL